MKAQLRIATKRDFCFIEATVEGTAAEIVDSYNELNEAYWKQSKSGPGLEKKAFDAFLDNQLSGGNNHIEQYEQMDEEQQNIVQAIKRSIKRIKAKQSN